VTAVLNLDFPRAFWSSADRVCSTGAPPRSSVPALVLLGLVSIKVPRFQRWFLTREQVSILQSIFNIPFQVGSCSSRCRHPSPCFFLSCSFTDCFSRAEDLRLRVSARPRFGCSGLISSSSSALVQFNAGAGGRVSSVSLPCI
jgi:hypothetical protein